jgi:hypothetical protein
MNKEKEYTLTCNRQQMELIAQALEMHSRAICGQIEETFSPPIAQELWKLHTDQNESQFFDKRRQVEEHLLAVKEIIWGYKAGASKGIGYDKTADLGYEMYKMILSKFESEREADCIASGKTYSGNVHTGTPLKLTDIPFIKIEDHESN